MRNCLGLAPSITKNKKEKKKKISVFTSRADPSGIRIVLQVLTPALPYGIPSPGHRLERAAPNRWATPPYNSSVQQPECTPFVIQPFNFFQMFPNKQQNKIKDFFFLPSTTKPNGPKLSQPVKQCQRLH